MTARRRRTERLAPRRFVVTERDREIVHAVGRMAQATTDQLLRLFFTERSTAARRLAKLTALRLLDVHVCGLSEPNIYTLSTKGLALLQGMGTDEVHRSRVGRHLDHHLRALNDLRVEFVLGTRARSDVGLEAFHGDLDLRRAAGSTPPGYLPDALVELVTPAGPLVLVAEIDTGSEGVSVFTSKVDTTVALWRSGRKCWGALPGTWRPAVFVPVEARARALSRVIAGRGGGALWLVAELGRVRQVGALGMVFATAEEVAATPRSKPVAYKGSLAAAPAGAPR